MKDNRGFTLVELIIVVTTLGVVSGFGYMAVEPAMRAREVDMALRTVDLEMRRARQQAVDSRRKHRVTFTAPDSIVTERQAPAAQGGAWSTIRTETLPGDLEFRIHASVSSGPDGYAFTQPINFSSSTTVYLMPDGSAITASGAITNGVVYVSRSGELDTMRAVTLFGATGNLTRWKYTYDGGSWQWEE